MECAFVRDISSFTDSVNKPLFKLGECSEKEGVAKTRIFAVLSWILVYFDTGVLGFQLSWPRGYQLLYSGYETSL